MSTVLKETVRYGIYEAKPKKPLPQAPGMLPQGSSPTTSHISLHGVPECATLWLLRIPVSARGV